MDSIVKHSVRADLRRNEDPSEDTKHFINLEIYGDSAAWKMPLIWDSAVRRYSKDTLLEYGYLPYHIISIKNLLINAFRRNNKDSILFYAADLSHYIGDAHVPLHTTLNYDGQLTGQKGMHSLWESIIPELELDQYNLNSKHKAKYLKNPEQAAWNAVRNAHLLLARMFDQEKEASTHFTDSSKYRVQVRGGSRVRSYSTAFAKAYSKKLGGTINQQLKASAELIADFWYSSWVDAGRPDLQALSLNGSPDLKKRLKVECKAFKANQLIDQKLLLSRHTMGTSAH
jgi:hypothetical protein